MFEQFYLNITSVNPYMDQSIHYVTRHYLEVLTQLDNDLLQVATCAHFRRAERNYTFTNENLNTTVPRLFRKTTGTPDLEYIRRLRSCTGARATPTLSNFRISTRARTSKLSFFFPNLRSLRPHNTALATLLIFMVSTKPD